MPRDYFAFLLRVEVTLNSCDHIVDERKLNSISHVRRPLNVLKNKVLRGELFDRQGLSHMVRNVLVGNVEMFDRLLAQLEAFLFSLRVHLWRNDKSLVRTSETALCFHDMLQVDFQGRQPLDPLRVHRVRHDAVASRLKRIYPRWLLRNACKLAEL